MYKTIAIRQIQYNYIITEMINIKMLAYQTRIRDMLNETDHRKTLSSRLKFKYLFPSAKY